MERELIPQEISAGGHLNRQFPASPARTVFLGGPIQHALHGGIFDGEMKEVLEIIIRALEEAGFTVLSAHRHEEFGKISMEGRSCEVTERDFQWMLDCDVFVAVLPSVNGELLRTDGTCIELGWASALRKPVVMIRDSDRVSHLMSGLRRVSLVSVLRYSLVKANPSHLVDEVTRALRIYEGSAGRPARKGRQPVHDRQEARGGQSDPQSGPRAEPSVPL